jgi:hypothetical protein
MVSPEWTGTVVTLPSRCFKENVAAEGANDFETEPLKNAHYLFALQSRKARHIEIC